MTMGRLMLAAVLLGSLSACGGNDTVADCDDAKSYESIVAGKRVEVPDGLDPLDELRKCLFRRRSQNRVRKAQGVSSLRHRH